MNRFKCVFAAILVVATVTTADAWQAPSSAPASAVPPMPFNEFDAHLMNGRISEALKLGERHASAPETENQGRFELGIAHFLDAFGALHRDLHRHGFRISAAAAYLSFIGVPLPGPLPENAAPAETRYEDTRRVLTEFAGRMEACATALERVPRDARVGIRIHAALISIDLDGDGGIDAEAEQLSPVLSAWLFRVPTMLTTNQGNEFELNLDRADVAWLRAYCNLMGGAAEFLLAHDYRELFDHTGHLVFPRVRSAFYDAAEARYSNERHVADFTDLIGFIHLLRLAVAEPTRLEKSHASFLRAVSESREMWRLARAEADNDHEWIPNERQTPPFPAIRVSAERIDSWNAFLDELQAVLEGKLLIGLPHVSDKRGVNLKRVFFEPRPFDLVMWLHGGAAVPYLEDGKMTDWSASTDLWRVFGGELWGFGMWVN